MEQQKAEQLQAGKLLTLYGVAHNRNANVLFDNGCNLYAIVAEPFVTACGLAQTPIPRSRVTGWDGEQNGEITGLVSMELDLQGLKKRMHMYVTKSLGDVDIILGHRWFELEGAIPNAKERTILCGQHTLKAQEDLVADIEMSTRAEIKQLKASNPRAFRATMADIEKALAAKLPKDLAKLPEQYREFKELFTEANAASLPPHREHHDLKIQLDQGAELPHGPLYHMTKDELLVLRKELNSLLEKRFIRPSSSPVSSPVLFVRKPNGGLRFCIDYRRLNSVARKDKYPLPLWKETLRQLGKAKWFTKLDVSAAFHRIRVREGDEWLTAFRTRFGLFEWKVSPFGFVNSPSNFQRYVNVVLQDYLDEFVTAYVDDFLVFSYGSLEDHQAKVRRVLQRLQQAELFLDIDKCEFEQLSVKYLGYIVGNGIVKMDPKKVTAIETWATPTSVKDVQTFLGFANFYRLFIQGYSSLTASLSALTKKGITFQWGKEQEQAFQALKTAFSTAEVLRGFDPDLPTRLETDASQWATGGVLSQKEDGEIWRPVAFHSRRLSPAECNYPIHDKELLAVIACLREWDAECRTVESLEVLTDHKSLEYFLTKRDLNDRQARWHELLSRHKLVFSYRPGSENGAADALSRRPQDLPKDDDERLVARQVQMIPKINRVQISQPAEQGAWEAAATADVEFNQWKTDVAKGCTQWTVSKPPVSIAECTIQENWLCFRGRKWAPNHEPLRTALIREAHDSPLAGHPGRNITAFALRRQFYWPQMDKDVARYIRNCDICGRNRIWREKEGLLRPLDIPGEIWKQISMDFVTELPESKDFTGRVCKHILVVVDQLSKGVEIMALPSLKTSELVDQFIDRIIRQHGIPHAIVSDRGAQFTGQMWKDVCSSLGIQLKLSTAFHPQTDGATERMNAVVKDFLRKHVNPMQDDWARWIPLAQIAINNRPAGATDLSPFFLTHGTHAITDGQLQAPAAGVAKAIRQKLDSATEWAQAALAAARQEMETRVNSRRRSSPRYQVGDQVWLSQKNIPHGTLQPKARKYRVVEVPNSHSVKLDVPGRMHNVFHVDMVRLAGKNRFPSQPEHDPQPEPIIAEDDQEPEYLVEKILDEKKYWKTRKFLVKWAGYLDPTWEPAANIDECAALDDWEARRRWEGGGSVTGRRARRLG